MVENDPIATQKPAIYQNRFQKCGSSESSVALALIVYLENVLRECISTL